MVVCYFVDFRFHFVIFVDFRIHFVIFVDFRIHFVIFVDFKIYLVGDIGPILVRGFCGERKEGERRDE